MQPAHILRLIDIAVTDVLNAGISHLGGNNTVAGANRAWVNHTGEADKLCSLINFNLFLTDHIQVAIRQYLVNGNGDGAGKGVIR
ncbi:hypothetical protein ERHA54_17170 [Erwinia rhapontici]|nr:hypothetical protein ERHA54_17170 [Erwinia rhapontici]